MSNSTKLITLRRMIRDLLLDSNGSLLSAGPFESRFRYHLQRAVMVLESDGIGDKLAETSDEENWKESGDFPDRLTVVETRRYGTQFSGDEFTIEVARQNPDSVLSGMEGTKDDWRQFYTADGCPKPYYLRKLP
jgi:hypothetical protein